MNLRRYCLVPVFSAALILTGLHARADETNFPSVACQQSVFDFGPVYPDSEVQHSFVLTNRGSRLVHLTKVNATCGCAKAVLSASDIQPGKTAELKVVINFKGRRGHLQKSIYVSTDESGAPPLCLEIKGTVLVPIEVQPEGAHFGTVGVEGTVEREVLLNAVGTNVFQVLSVVASSTQLSAACETLEAGKRYRVRISSEGPRAYGSTMASVRVVTDNVRMPQVDIPVAAFVAGDVVVMPALLLVVPTDTNIVKTAALTLWSPSRKPFKVTGVTCPGDGGMTASVSTGTPDRIRIEVKTRGPLTGVGGKSVRIETDLPSMKEVLVPVKVLTREGDASAAGRP
jgi:hypothetical protein